MTRCPEGNPNCQHPDEPVGSGFHTNCYEQSEVYKRYQAQAEASAAALAWNKSANLIRNGGVLVFDEMDCADGDLLATLIEQAEPVREQSRIKRAFMRLMEETGKNAARNQMFL